MKREYTRVWGDTVCLTELFMSSIIGIVITMGMYYVIRVVLSKIWHLPDGMINGYALIGGICGCFISGMITSRHFKPKREVIEGTEQMNLENVLQEAGSSLKMEAEALSKESPEVIEEMENLELYSLLSLIPENSPNYNPKYKEMVERKIKV